MLCCVMEKVRGDDWAVVITCSGVVGVLEGGVMRVAESKGQQNG